MESIKVYIIVSYRPIIKATQKIIAVNRTIIEYSIIIIGEKQMLELEIIINEENKQ